MSIRIDDDSRLVGAKASKNIAGPMGIERTYMDRVNMIAMPFHGQDVKFPRLAGKRSRRQPGVVERTANHAG